jgi:hypothetical protein
MPDKKNSSKERREEKTVTGPKSNNNCRSCLNVEVILSELMKVGLYRGNTKSILEDFRHLIKRKASQILNTIITVSNSSNALIIPK